jgi:hypothetical protein
MAEMMLPILGEWFSKLDAWWGEDAVAAKDRLKYGHGTTQEISGRIHNRTSCSCIMTSTQQPPFFRNASESLRPWRQCRLT